MSMNPEIKAQWVAALRSGEFEQGRGNLNANDRMCCLGVLAELAFREGACDKSASTGSIITYYGYQSEYLPGSVAKWAELDFTGNAFDPTIHGDVSLSELNDIGKSFEYIADEIEKHL